MPNDSEDPLKPASAPAGPESASSLKPFELVSLAMQLRGRVDSEWQRAVNLHAALIAVMIFFANQPDPFVAARLIVFVFYTYNVVMLLRGLTDSYAGLRDVTSDLARLPPPEQGRQSLRWLTARRYRQEGRFQCTLLVIVWMVIGYLMLSSLVLGRTTFHP